MSEPLTNSRLDVVFSGKSHNNHPSWYNEPLRLTEEQRNDPSLVFYEFFQCYHLYEARKLLWDWLTEIVSSSGSISEDPHDRNNQIYFYENIEKLIEAALIITRSAKSKTGVDSTLPIVDDNEENEETSYKPKRLLEYADKNPLYVLTQVFSPDKAFIIGEIKEWLLIGLSVDSTVYDEAEQRSSLVVFHDHLITLIEALFVIALQKSDNFQIKDQISGLYTLTELTQSQIADPQKVLIAFFEKFPIKNAIRELDDWYEASISYSGEWRGNVVCLQQIYDIYRNVQCLIKSAKQLLK